MRTVHPLYGSKTKRRRSERQQPRTPRKELCQRCGFVRTGGGISIALAGTGCEDEHPDGSPRLIVCYDCLRAVLGFVHASDMGRIHGGHPLPEEVLHRLELDHFSLLAFGSLLATVRDREAQIAHMRETLSVVQPKLAEIEMRCKIVEERAEAAEKDVENADAMVDRVVHDLEAVVAAGGGVPKTFVADLLVHRDMLLRWRGGAEVLLDLAHVALEDGDVEPVLVSKIKHWLEEGGPGYPKKEPPKTEPPPVAAPTEVPPAPTGTP